MKIDLKAFLKEVVKSDRFTSKGRLLKSLGAQTVSAQSTLSFKLVLGTTSSPGSKGQKDLTLL